MLPDWYPALVAIHLIAMVTFFASSFCVLRLFLMHRQAQRSPEPERSILARHSLAPARTLLQVAGWPSLLLLWLTGGWMAALQPALLAEPWIQAKLGLLALLTAFHAVDHRLYTGLHRGERSWGANALRLWALCAVLLLLAVVTLSTFRKLQWYLGLLGLLILALLLYTAIKGASREEPTDHAQTGDIGA